MSRRRVTVAGLAAYSLVLAFLVTSMLNQRLPTGDMVLQSGRQELIRSAIDVLDQGGPPLLGSSIPYATAKTMKQPPIYPAGLGDDEGIYLYLPVAGHLLHVRDPLTLLKWFFIVMMALLVVVYPLVFYATFGSVAAAVVAPWLVAYRFTFLRNTDIYWISAWVVLMCVPLLLLAVRQRRSPRICLSLLVAADVLASFSSSVRAGAGTPIFLASLGVAVLAVRPWRWRLGVAALLVAADYSVTKAVFGLMRLYRDHEVTIPTAAGGLETSHSLWHPAYLGLGYLPNRFGIRWSDAVAVHAAQRVDPHVVYLSPRYNEIVRHLYFNVVRSDPGFAFHTYFVKACETLNAGLARFWLPLALLPLACVAGRGARNVRIGAILVLPAIATTLVPPIMTLPSYSTGWLGALGVVGVLVVAWMATNLGIAARRAIMIGWRVVPDFFPPSVAFDRTRLAWDDLGAKRQRSLTYGLAAMLLILILAPAVRSATDAVHRDNLQGETYQASSTQPLPVHELPAGRVTYTAYLGRSLPAGWSTTTGTTLSAFNGKSKLTTTTIPNGNQLASRSIELHPGTYTVVLRGAVRSGGLTLSVSDLRTHEVIAASSYWSGQHFGSGNAMTATFTVRVPTHARIVLRNWRVAPGASAWSLASIRIVRSVGPARGRS